jgi:hypothetical protein
MTGRSSLLRSRRRPICLGPGRSTVAAAGSVAVVVPSARVPANFRCSRRFRRCLHPIFLGPSISQFAAAGSAAVFIPSSWVPDNHQPQQPVPQPLSSHLPGSLPITGRSTASAAVVVPSAWVPANLGQQKPNLHPSSSHLPGSQPISDRSSWSRSRRSLIYLGPSQSPTAVAGSAAIIVLTAWVPAYHRPQQPVPKPSSSHLPGSQPIFGRSC